MQLLIFLYIIMLFDYYEHARVSLPLALVRLYRTQKSYDYRNIFVVCKKKFLKSVTSFLSHITYVYVRARTRARACACVTCTGPLVMGRRLCQNYKKDYIYKCRATFNINVRVYL